MFTAIASDNVRSDTLLFEAVKWSGLAIIGGVGTGRPTSIGRVTGRPS